MKKRVLAGMRATGTLHLGNYLGGVKGMLALQENAEYETLYMVADMHAVTTPYDVTELRKNRRAVLLDYLAAGLDPEKSILFLQSDVQLHGELAFYFSSVMTMARMQHLPTFKDKVRQYPDNVTMALLNYPVLMSADILLYKADKVPVGIDQEPHLEVAREVARKMNDQYGLSFPEPTRFVTEGEYVPSLLGTGKMSKSVEGSAINLTDDLDTIHDKLKKAPTDSGTGDSVPESGGVANLLTLVELFQGSEKRDEYEQAYLGSGIRYGDLKRELAEVIYMQIKPIQEKRAQLEADPEYVQQVIDSGAQKARKIAQETMSEVRSALGLQ